MSHPPAQRLGSISGAPNFDPGICISVDVTQVVNPCIHTFTLKNSYPQICGLAGESSQRSCTTFTKMSVTAVHKLTECTFSNLPRTMTAITLPTSQLYLFSQLLLNLVQPHQAERFALKRFVVLRPDEAWRSTASLEMVIQYSSAEGRRVLAF